MDFAHEENESSDEASSSTATKGKEQLHRHSVEQVKQLEVFFKDCQNPTKKQRQELSEELRLEPRQIKIWFQNKRNQTRHQSERDDNDALRAENQRLYFENLAMKGILMYPFCVRCEGEAAKQQHLQALRDENARLQKKLEGLVNHMAYLHKKHGM